MATTKMTNKVAFELAISALSASTLPDKDEAIAKIAKAIEQLEKKNSKTSGKLTPKQTANLAIGDAVVEFLRSKPTQMFSISELLKQVEGLPEDMSSQRMTAIFRQDNVRPYYRRETVKGKSYFQYREAVETEEEEG